ncbi:class II aldolase/adducin family protein [Salinicola rhizosphaerae]|uniref:Class II aldolase n=1 Tax=Salinicola rhizosphaerae TaxID=1443141 RepID=A0ABQ3DXF0_9GAMM|nr:class II aldolase/adducin family protein [Salinicola rhizosphaerae]GHB17115.1 class II aldolase [Salinicola rhizosphaerae]
MIPEHLRHDAKSEAEVRVELAALYRLVAHLRMTDLIYTHISARVPGPEHHFLINPYGLLFSEVTASSLVKVDLDGNVIEKGAGGGVINPAGFTIHSALHHARPDLTCIVHTHTAAGIAISTQKQGLLPITQHALKFHGRLSYHGYEGIATDHEERERLARDLGTNKAMILRNHGLLVGGRTIPEAFDQIYFLERACQAQLAAQSGGAELIWPPKSVRDHVASQYDDGGYAPWIEPAWQAVLRDIASQRESYAG